MINSTVLLKLFSFSACLKAFVCAVLMTFAAQSASAANQEFPRDFAFGGYDVVSYFSNSGPQVGQKNISIQYANKLYAFSSRQNALKFKSDPSKYLPQYNGNCAFGMVYGAKSSVDPLVYEIVDDKLFFLINHGTHKLWKKSAAKNIKRSDRAWKKLSKNY